VKVNAVLCLSTLSWRLDSTIVFDPLDWYYWEYLQILVSPINKKLMKSNY